MKILLTLFITVGFISIGKAQFVIVDSLFMVAESKKRIFKTLESKELDVLPIFKDVKHQTNLSNYIERRINDTIPEIQYFAYGMLSYLRKNTRDSVLSRHIFDISIKGCKKPDRITKSICIGIIMYDIKKDYWNRKNSIYFEKKIIPKLLEIFALFPKDFEFLPLKLAAVDLTPFENPYLTFCRETYVRFGKYFKPENNGKLYNLEDKILPILAEKKDEEARALMVKLIEEQDIRTRYNSISQLYMYGGKKFADLMMKYYFDDRGLEMMPDREERGGGIELGNTYIYKYLYPNGFYSIEFDKKTKDFLFSTDDKIQNEKDRNKRLELEKAYITYFRNYLKSKKGKLKLLKE